MLFLKNINLIKKIVFCLSLAILSGCFSTTTATRTKRYYYKPTKTSHAKYKGHYKIGSKYKVNGRTYKPYKYSRYRKVGVASWYGSKDGFHGKKTANGDVFNKHMLTAAHPTLPLPCMVRVTNLKNKKSVILMVNDRGPFRKNRILDASERAASMLGYRHHGTARVKVEYLHDETKALLWKLSLPSRHGARPHAKMKDHRCSVACYLDRVNRKKARL